MFIFIEKPLLEDYILKITLKYTRKHDLLMRDNNFRC